MIRLPVYLWAFPTTCLGLPFVLLAWITGGEVRQVHGVLEVSGPAIARFLKRCTLIGASAMTLGHIIIARDQISMARSRVHEHVHVRQCEKWGPLFIPAYLMASLLAFLRGEDPYFGNRFEREAYEKEAGMGGPVN